MLPLEDLSTDTFAFRNRPSHLLFPLFLPATQQAQHTLARAASTSREWRKALTEASSS